MLKKKLARLRNKGRTNLKDKDIQIGNKFLKNEQRNYIDLRVKCKMTTWQRMN